MTFKNITQNAWRGEIGTARFEMVDDTLFAVRYNLLLIAVHTHIHTYTHTYTHTYIHTYMHTYMADK